MSHILNMWGHGWLAHKKILKFANFIMVSNTQDEKIWSSKMENSLKIRTFKATIEPILLFDSELWTIDSTMRKKIYDCYTRLLRMATNIS